MADQIRVDKGYFGGVPIKLVDNGDGSYSQQVSATFSETVSSTLYSGTLSATTTPAALAATQAVREVTVQNDPANTVNVLVGNATTQAFILAPGDALVVPINDIAKVFAVAASSTATVRYLARN